MGIKVVKEGNAMKHFLQKILFAIIIATGALFSHDSFAGERPFGFCDEYDIEDQEEFIDGFFDNNRIISGWSREGDEWGDFSFFIDDEQGFYRFAEFDLLLDNYEISDPNYINSQPKTWMVRVLDYYTDQEKEVTGKAICIEHPSGDTGETSEDYGITWNLDTAWANGNYYNGIWGISNDKADICLCKRDTPGMSSPWVFIDLSVMDYFSNMYFGEQECSATCASACMLHFYEYYLYSAPLLLDGICEIEEEYTVDLVQNTSDNDNTEIATINVVNGQPMPRVDVNGNNLTAPTRLDYIFNGYYDARTGGTKYYNANMTSAQNWNKNTDSILYAQWGRTNTVNLYQNVDPNNDTLNTTVTVNTGSVMPTTNTSGQTLTAPMRNGYKFNGYYDARTGGTKYYNANMTSAHTWDSNIDGALYAQWVYMPLVTLYQNESAEDTTVNATVRATTGSSMPTTNTSGQTLATPTREGYIFNGYWSERTGGQQYYNASMLPVRVWNSDADGSLYAQWFDKNNVKFILTTTSTDSFQFTISAAGIFTVDCGDGGTLGGYQVSGNTIRRYYTGNDTYTCSWSWPSKVHTIAFSGTATGYSTEYGVAAISFYVGSDGGKKVASISGSLGAIFGTASNPGEGEARQPKFYQTFFGAYNMKGAIPENLFSGISGAPINRMFQSTFAGCTGLTGSIPANLFSGISGAPANNMFDSTFSGCSNLSGYIPPNLFAGISTSTTAGGQMGNVFNNTGLSTSCPVNTYQYTTGFESYFGGKVSCTPCPNNGTSPAGSTSVSQCVAAQSCPANYHVPANHPEMCFSSVLHLDDTRPNDIVYLKDAATTSPALNIDIDDDGVNDGFANLTTTRTVMTDTSSHYLTVPVNGVTYYVCDDTSCPQ